jgi:IS605 OrfB family transposase
MKKQIHPKNIKQKEQLKNILLLNKQESILTHQILPLENGQLKEKLKQLELDQLKNTEGIKLQSPLNNQLHLASPLNSSATQESQLKNKKKIWKRKFPCSQASTITTELLKTLDQDLTSKEKVLIPFWNKQSEEISKNLLLPTKTDYVDLDLKSSSTSFPLPVGGSWFSMIKKVPQNLKWQKISFPSSLFSPVDYMGGGVTEIKEVLKINPVTKNEEIFVRKYVDKDEVTHKTLRFHLFLDEKEKKEILKPMCEQTKWYYNMCIDVFQKENNLEQLKKNVKNEKELLKEYSSKKKIITETIKGKMKQKEEIKKLIYPEKTYFDYTTFRDEMRTYEYVETPFEYECVIADFIKNPKRNQSPDYPKDWWNDKPYDRVARGCIKNFVTNMNSMVSNYRNSERDFSLNYKTKKNTKEHIFFEDKEYPKIINSLRSKYCYTKWVENERGVRHKKRCSITLEDIKEQVCSIVITHDKTIDKYYLNVSMPVDFYLPGDKRSENQASFSKENKDINLDNGLQDKKHVDPSILPCMKVIALDPGLRTFLTGYSLDGISCLGDGCCNDIFDRLLYLDSLEIKEDMNDDKKHSILKARWQVRKQVKDMVEDLHWKTIKYLTSNYKVVIYPDFRTQGMMKKLSKENKRKMAALSFHEFKNRLIYKCKTNRIHLIITTEEFTSRTCCTCGFLNAKSTEKMFHCKNCKTDLDRDINGASNILIKTIGMLSRS